MLVCMLISHSGTCLYKFVGFTARVARWDCVHCLLQTSEQAKDSTRCWLLVAVLVLP